MSILHTQSMVRRALVVSVLSMSVVALVGCAPKAKPTSAKSVASLRDTRDEIALGRKQVDAVLLSLDTIKTAQGDLRAPVGKYQAEVKNTATQRARIASRVADMKARATEYQTKWREESAQLQDPTLRAAAVARADEVKARFEKIAALGNDASAAYEPFYKSLTELSAYLTHDLTPAGVTAAKPVFDKTSAQGKELGVKLDAMLAEIDAVATSLAPPKVVAPAK